MPESRWANANHAHLEGAIVGFVLSDIEPVRSGKVTLGQAELVTPAKSFAAGRKEAWCEDAFGALPDFLITLNFCYVQACADEGNTAAICALVEHELRHCAQATDQNGDPKYDQHGNPMWTIAPHDIEEFFDVIERYGPANETLRRLTEAVAISPTLAPRRAAGTCGTCGGAL